MTLNVVGITTGSTLMGAHATAVPESIANAINQLSANQLALMTQISQIAAMSLAQGHKHFPSQQRKHLLSNKLQFRPSNPLPAQQQGVSKQDCQSEGGAAEGTGATDVADMAQGVAVGEMNVRHLPTTNRGSRNRGSKDVDAERADSSPNDRQDSSRRHRLGVTTHQQCPRSTSSSGSQITMCVICAGTSSY